MSPVTRRRFLAASATAAAASSTGAVAAPGAGDALAARRRPAPPLGAGGTPTDPERLAALARQVANGSPVTFLDLAAFDANLATVTAFAREQGFAVRPALKSFHNAAFIAYTLQRLPAPLGMIFHLRTVDEIVPRAPRGTDLLMGYPPAFDEVRAFLRTRAPRGARPHRVRLLVDSLELLEHVARLARRSRRPLPLDIALQLESGFHLSGFETAEQLRPALELLRRERRRLRLSAVLCYDGHASFRGERAFRQTIADEAQRRLAAWMRVLRAEAADLADPDALVVNGPGSSTYRLWAGNPDLTEISPGAALLFHGYITGDGYDNAGLEPTLHHVSPVHRKGTGLPLTGAGRPTSPDTEEISVKGGAWPTAAGTLSEVVFPRGLEADDLSGGRGNNQAHFLAPRGVLDRGDYVVFRPRHAGDAVDYFGALVAVRDGRVRRVWPSFRQVGDEAFVSRPRR